MRTVRRWTTVDLGISDKLDGVSGLYLHAPPRQRIMIFAPGVNRSKERWFDEAYIEFARRHRWLAGWRNIRTWHCLSSFCSGLRCGFTAGDRKYQPADDDLLLSTPV